MTVEEAPFCASDSPTSGKMRIPRSNQYYELGMGSDGTSSMGYVNPPSLGSRKRIAMITVRDPFLVQVAGKIVLFNVPFTTYSETVQYRYRGAIEAGRLGAIGALLRSVSSFSMGNPHTGATRYEEGTQPIPFAAIAVEAAGGSLCLTFVSECQRYSRGIVQK